MLRDIILNPGCKENDAPSGYAPRIMRYKVVLEQSEEGFSVSVPGLPGCHSQGATEQEALENIADAILEYLEVVAELSRDKVTREVEV
jgi:predicted RNase H-like HicB family nuclease